MECDLGFTASTWRENREEVLDSISQVHTILVLSQKKLLNRVLAVGIVAWRRDWKCLVFWQLWAVMPGELVWKRLVYEYCAKRFY